MVEKSDFKHIVRIANVDLPGEKSIQVALQKIKGISFNLAKALCSLTKVDHNIKTGNLSTGDLQKLNDTINNISKSSLPKWLFNRKKDYESGEDLHIITGNLNLFKDNDIKRMKKIKSYKGIRHLKGLPVRGQRTRSNFRKSKGKVVGVAKKKAVPGKK